MKFRVGAKVCIKNVYSGGNFDNGDIVIIKQIGNEYEPDCYGAISPYDGLMWFLHEDEIGPATNADRIRSMSDEELAKFLASVEYRRAAGGGGAHWYEADHALEWLRQPVEEDAPCG